MKLLARLHEMYVELNSDNISMCITFRNLLSIVALQVMKLMETFVAFTTYQYGATSG